MSRKPTILCVDDRADSLLVRKQMLELFGCEVTVALDSRACMEGLRENRVDLVIIDYHLAEETNGEDLARQIRKALPRLPLIMLTGDSQFPDSVLESVNAVLVKGASSPKDMLDLIQNLVPDATLRRRQPPPEPTVKTS